MANSVANEFRRLRGMSAPGSDVGREPGLRIADWPSLNAHRIRRKREILIDLPCSSAERHGPNQRRVARKIGVPLQHLPTPMQACRMADTPEA